MYLSLKDSLERVSGELRRNLSDFLREPGESLGRKAVSILTTGQDLVIRLPRTERELILLTCATWYFPKELGILIRLKIEEEMEHFPDHTKARIVPCLSSEPEMILYILESDVLGRNPNEVFGNILGSRVKFKIYPNRPRKPRKLVRHRGYRDKGSLGRNSEISQEEKKDSWLTEEQNSIELHRKEQNDSSQIVLGFIQ